MFQVKQFSSAALSMSILGFANSLCLGQSSLPPLPPPLLSISEKRAAVGIATSSNLVRFGVAEPLDPSQRLLTGVISVQSKGGASERLALVIQYDYEAKAVIKALVDVSAGAVKGVTAVRDHTPPLAPSERERATVLALGDARVRDALGHFAETVRVIASISLITDPQDPLYGNRVAWLLFRTSDGYLRMPFRILVNLTNNSVQIR